jgi:hypothetical protein
MSPIAACPWREAEGSSAVEHAITLDSTTGPAAAALPLTARGRNDASGSRQALFRRECKPDQGSCE